MVGRAWLVIPAMGVVAAVIALSHDAAPGTAVAVGLAGAAIAAAARGLARSRDGDEITATVAAVIAATVAGFALVALGADELDALATIAAGFAIAELRES